MLLYPKYQNKEIRILVWYQYREMAANAYCFPVLLKL